MRRREFIAAIGGAAAAWPLATRAQEPDRIYRLGLMTASFKRVDPPMAAFFDELRVSGFVEGQNLKVDGGAYGPRDDQLPEIVAAMAKSPPDVIWCSTVAQMRATQEAVRTVPIVGMTSDMIAAGLVKSFARPDGNITGISLLSPELDAKRQDIIIEAVPGVRRMAMLADAKATGVVVDSGLEIWAKRVQLLLETARKVTKVGHLLANPTNVTLNSRTHGAYIREAAERSGIAMASVVVAGKIDRAAYERTFATVIVGGEKVDRTAYEKTFDAMEKEGVDGLIVGEEGEHLAHRQLIADLATRFRVPAIYPYREFVEVGGLMAYGVDLVDIYRRVANMTGEVLRGAKPSDIPFYRQTKFELVINQKAATSLGLEFPPTLLTAADEVIE
jgi:putative tryptophan/tyrosine transport system substrate-binding protein